jgi:hypothetical protein
VDVEGSSHMLIDAQKLNITHHPFITCSSQSNMIYQQDVKKLSCVAVSLSVAVSVSIYVCVWVLKYMVII